MTGKRPALSQQRMRILNLLNLGKGRKEIARHLTISAETVRGHIDQIKSELGVPTGEDIVYTVRRAYELGVLKGRSPLLIAEAERQRRGKDA